MEMLYEALQEKTLTLPIAQGSRMTTITLRLADFVTVAATTDPDRMPRPLRDRFTHQEVLDVYGEDALAVLAERTAGCLKRPLTEAAARLLARVAHGTPRRLIAMVRCARDVAVARSRPAIDIATVRDALCARGIDERGLEPGHRRTLDLLRRHGRPVGRRRLAGQLGMSVRLFLDAVEPMLLRLGLVHATPRGLVIAGFGDRVAEGGPRVSRGLWVPESLTARFRKA
ncbi:MAG TPA: hypothetical protein ENK43_03005 [Planctomycetes bacterium]|nr:hypothetical protein [Planctomycetota bacterium]